MIGFADPGDLVGLEPEPHRLNAQATRASHVKCLPRRSIERAVRQNPALAIRVWELIARELSAAHSLLLTIGQRTAAERVAAFLLELSRRKTYRGEDAQTIVLPLTRTDIGDLLALTIETVSRILSQLRRHKIIDLQQSSLVQIRDIEALRQLARGATRL